MRELWAHWCNMQSLSVFIRKPKFGLHLSLRVAYAVCMRGILERSSVVRDHIISRVLTALRGGEMELGRGGS
jgi:hypothetical protein